MSTYTPTTKFVTPPENQGQIVTHSYAYAAEGVIIERVHDASDRTTRYYAYKDDGSEWDPWNGVPALGESLGECQVSDE